MPSLILNQSAALPPTGPEVALKVAADCALHGLPLPAEHVRMLLQHVRTVHGAAAAADRFWRDVQRMCHHRSDKVAPVPEDIARRARNNIRGPLGWPLIRPGETP